jgi:hypothetical protein
LIMDTFYEWLILIALIKTARREKTRRAV